jgi:leucyl aminopeptidase
MKLKIRFEVSTRARADASVFLIYQDDSAKLARDLKKYEVVAKNLSRLGFSGKQDESLELCASSDTCPILLGMSEKEKSTPDNARRAGGILAGIASKRGIRSILLCAIPEPKDTLGPFIEGLILGGYKFDQFKSDKKADVNITLMLGGEFRKFKKLIGKALVLAEAACFTRDLVNTPANYLTPSSYAAKASALGRKYKIRTRIYSRRELENMKMGALLGVAKGSDLPPQLITYTYRGGKPGDKPIVLVGKGVTFDTGGISLKPNESMVDMKNDMAGSAAVVSQIIILGRLKPKVNVIGIIPAVENMPSGKALKPSDVIVASDGQSIEVMNTDAEGRLILADALCFAHKFKPKVIIDIATLTGACKIALGTNAAGILGNDEALLDKLYYLGQQTSERTWQLPLWDEYYEQIKSEVADMKNTGGRPAGTITAAAFLSKFVRKVPWAHIDIAAMDNQEGSHPYQPKGATGFGTRLLAEFLLGG